MIKLMLTIFCGEAFKKMYDTIRTKNSEHQIGHNLGRSSTYVCSSMYDQPYYVCPEYIEENLMPKLTSISSYERPKNWGFSLSFEEFSPLSFSSMAKKQAWFMEIVSFRLKGHFGIINLENTEYVRAYLYLDHSQFMYL